MKFANKDYKSVHEVNQKKRLDPKKEKIKKNKKNENDKLYDENNERSEGYMLGYSLESEDNENEK